MGQSRDASEQWVWGDESTPDTGLGGRFRCLESRLCYLTAHLNLLWKKQPLVVGFGAGFPPVSSWCLQRVQPLEMLVFRHSFQHFSLVLSSI